MKKLLLLVVTLCSVATLSAQVKGDKYFGGSLGVSATSVIMSGESSATVGLSIEPEFSYFVANNFKIGVEAAYGIDNANAIHTIQLLPNIAYYVRLCDGFYYVPELGAGFVMGISEGYAIPGFGVGLSLGTFEFRPTKKFGMSVSLLSLSYVMLTLDDGYYRSSANSFDVRLGSSPSVGLKYYF